MANPHPPPYPGFQPQVAPGSAPYPQQPGAGQYPQAYIGPYPQASAHGQYPQQAGGQYPQQAGGQYPPQAGGQYPPQPGFVPYPPYSATGPSPQPFVAGDPQAHYGPAPVHSPLTDPGYYRDEEKDMPGWTGFTDKAIRAIFIRKVYAIIMLQLLFSLAVIALFVFEPNVKRFVQRNLMWYYVSYFIFFAVYITLLCCGDVRRKYPANVILLAIFTMAMSYMLGTISSIYETKVVLMAIGICAGVCLAVSLFSFHSKFDFTSCGGVLMMLTLVLFLFGILTIFTYNSIMTTVYAGAGALLFVLFLAYDTQMLMGGKKYQLSAEEHIVAAMQIYLDIVYIFTFLLMLLGSGKNN